MEKIEVIKNIAARTGGDIYLGVVGAVRTGKSTFIRRFMENLVVPNIQDEFEKNKIILEKQSKQEKMKEYMILGLRKIDGISIQEFENIFYENPIMIYKNELNKLVKEELILIDGDIIKLTNKGLDLANLVWREFI